VFAWLGFDQAQVLRSVLLGESVPINATAHLEFGSAATCNKPRNLLRKALHGF
jgi:hypothetical protein